MAFEWPEELTTDVLLTHAELTFLEWVTRKYLREDPIDKEPNLRQHTAAAALYALRKAMRDKSWEIGVFDEH